MAVLARKKRVITVANEKGGVGKTTIIRLLPFILSQLKYKCLVIDMDPQGNTTDSLFVTRERYNKDEITVYKKTLMRGIQDDDIRGLEIPINDFLYFIPSTKDLKSYIPFLSDRFGVAMPGKPNYMENKQKQLDFFKEIIEGIDDSYDFIFIDTPPTASEFIDTTSYASDYIIMACQTQTDSLKGAKNFLEDTLVPLVNDFGADIEVVGVLLNQFDKRGSVDRDTIQEAYEYFGESNVFENIILYSKAIQHIPKKGITRQGQWNALMFDKVFEPIAQEFLQRISLLEDVE